MRHRVELCLGEPGGLWIRIGIKDRLGHGSFPGQKPRLLTSCEYASRATASGKCGTPPGCGGAGRPEKRVTARSKLPQKEMDRAAFPAETGAKILENAVGLDQDPPETVGLSRIVGAMRFIFLERDTHQQFR